MPIKQQPLSAAIDEALHQHLLSTVPSVRARALALSSALPHAGNWLNGIPSSTLGLHLQDQEFRCCLRYWLGVPLHSSPYSCPECHNTAHPFGDHQVGCGGNGDRITRHNAIRDVVFIAAQSAALEMPNLIPDSLSRPADVFLPTWSRGRPAVFLSFPLSSSRPWGRLRPLQATPCRLGFNGSWPPIYQPAGPLEWSSSRLSWRLWGVWLKTPSSSFAHWGRPSPRESAPWTRQLKPRSAPNSSSTELLSPCGGGMPPNGFTASQLSLPQRTALFNFSLFSFFLYLFPVLYILLICNNCTCMSYLSPTC